MGTLPAGIISRVVEYKEYCPLISEKPDSDSTKKHATPPTPTPQPWSTHANLVLMLAWLKI